MVESGSRSDRGYALIVAVWVVGLVSLMVLTFSTALRSHVKATGATAGRTQAEALADAGISLALLDLQSRAAAPRFRPDGTASVCATANGTVAVAVTHGSGRVDLNAASERLLQALFIAAGVDLDQAAGMAAAVVDYRDPDAVARSRGAEDAEYEAAGRTQRPRNGPFLAASELGQVLGVPAAVVERLADYVTVHSGASGLDAAYAAPELVAQLKEAVRLLPLQPSTGLDLGGFDALPAEFRSVGERRAYVILSEGRTGAFAFAREIVVDFTPVGPRPYRIVATRIANAGRLAAATQIGPC